MDLVCCGLKALHRLCVVFILYIKNSVLTYNQQDATLHNLFISVKSFTCFSRFLRPSSGAQTVYTASGTLSNLYCYLPRQWQVAVKV